MNNLPFSPFSLDVGHWTLNVRRLFPLAPVLGGEGRGEGGYLPRSLVPSPPPPLLCVQGIGEIEYAFVS